MREIDRRSIRLLVDLQACQTGGSAKRGVGRYSRALFCSLAESGSPRDLYGLVSSHLPDPPPITQVSAAKLLHAPALPEWTLDRDFEGGEGDTIDDLLWSAVAAPLCPDIIHVSHVFEGLHERVPLPNPRARPAGQVMSATLYDLIPLRFPETYFVDARFERWYRFRVAWLRQADLLLAISEASRQDAIRLLHIDPARVVTIHGGIDPHFKPVPDIEAARRNLRERYRLYREGFVLYTGGDEYRKNLRGAIRGFAALPASLRKGLHLIVVCELSDARKDHFLGTAAEAGLGDGDVIFTGYVPEDDLVQLYSTCTVFVFPSLYEGLGLPVIEAMACGAPVLGTDSSSIRELIGREEALFDAAQPDMIAQRLSEVITNAAFADDLRSYGLKRAEAFTWTATAERALEAFDDALRRKREAGVKAASLGWLPRRHLAMLTPLPPSKSGIADYNAQFLPFLAEHFDIDLYVSGQTVSDRAVSSAFRVFNAQDFAANADAYDSILYEIGNSDHHAHMLPLLDRWPGVVGLHDAYLSGLIGYLEFVLGEKDRYAREMLWAHGSQARHLLAPVRRAADHVYKSMMDLPCTKRVLDGAIGIISHSPFNLNLARHFNPEGWRAPYRTIPQMIPVPEPWTADRARTARQALGFRVDDVIVTTFGHIAWTKCGDRLLDAFLTTELANDPRIHLVFAGELANDDFGRGLLARTRKSHVRDRIRITGFLPETDYVSYLRIADVAVQLRTKSRGGTPKGVLDCLAYRVPTIANDEGSYKDYPDDVLRKLSTDPDAGEIARAILDLVRNEEQRESLAARGLEYVRQRHEPRRCAAEYAAAIKEFTDRWEAKSPASYGERLATHIAGCPDPAQVCDRAARFLDARGEARFARDRLLVNVSHVVQDDHKTGIPRVVKEFIRSAYCRNRPGMDVMAVIRAGDNLIEPTDWLASLGVLLPHEAGSGSDSLVELRPGDRLLMLDSTWAEYDAFQPIFEAARQAKAPVITAIYDILPLTLPPGNIVEGGKEWFAEWLKRAAAESDSLVCISKSVADDLQAYLVKNGLGKSGLRIGYWHLGSDFGATAIRVAAGEVKFSNITTSPYFLMVGTIEPRKNHELALAAFERLWSKGFNFNLVIVGRHGWLMEHFVERLRKHRFLNEKLFLFEEATDAEIAELYRQASALLMLSKGEGFGLPLVEAAHFGAPIVCSDIPVFREIAGNHAHYVSIRAPIGLSGAMLNSSKTIIRARPAMCCGGCTTKSTGPKQNWCVSSGARFSTSPSIFANHPLTSADGSVRR